MIDTLGRVLIFFSFIALGALLSRLKRLTLDGLDGLSAFFYWLAFPAWLLASFSQLPHPDAATGMTLLLYVIAMIGSAGVIVITAHVIKSSRTDAIPAGFAALINNSAFLGIPVATSLFGAGVAHAGPLVVAADFLALFSLGCAALAKASGHTVREALWRTARNPTVIGALIGVALMAAGWRLPPIVENAVDLMGKTASPVALVALGGMLGLMPAAALIRPDISSALATAGKLLLAPACVAAALSTFHPDPLLFKVCVFMSACPTAVSAFIQCKVYGVWPQGAAKAVAQSTVISLITLSVLALVLTRLA